MPNTRKPSPARSKGVVSTPRQVQGRSRSVGSPARTNLRLSSIISDSFKLSPVPSRRSVLNDDTDIEMPARRSWYKKLGDNSNVQQLLERNDVVEVNNVADETEVEILSQEKNYTLDLPESSSCESITSIIIPQRKLFKRVGNKPKNKFGQIMNTRESLNNPEADLDNEVNIEPKKLFNQPSKPRTKLVFPAALLNLTANKTMNKTMDMPPAEVQGQVRSLFGARQGAKRKNIFADFILCESEDDEIPEIQPRMFGFQKKNEQKRRGSATSRYSTTSSIDLEIDDWRLLPSSTMVENDLEEASPVKRAKLNKSKANQIENIVSNTPTKTNTANKSINSRNKFKNVSKTNFFEDEDEEVNEIAIRPQNSSMNSSKVTRSTSLRDNSVTSPSPPKNMNKSKDLKRNKSMNTSKNIKRVEPIVDKEQEQNMNNDEEREEDFTLQYDNDEAVKDTTQNSNSAENTNNSAVNTKESAENINKNASNTNKRNTSKEASNDEEIKNTSNTKKHERGNKNQSTLIPDESVQNTSAIVKEKERNRSKSTHNSSKNKSTDDLHDSKISRSIRNVDVDKSINETNKQLNKENVGDELESVNIQQNNHEIEVDSDMNEKSKDATINDENYYHNDQPIADATIQGDDVLQVDEEQNETLKYTNKNDEKQSVSKKKQSTKNVSGRVSSPNLSHETTGNRKKEEIQIRSPELLRNSALRKSREIDSFTVQGRNTSVRKTKSIITKDKSLKHSLVPVRESVEFSDGTRESSAEGSGWDSHRTTRKTLRQTFGKDFSPRKSLRVLVMEKTAKLQASNLNEVADNKKNPQARSTVYGEVPDEFHSYQEPEPVQVEESVESVENKENIGEKDVQNDNEKEVEQIKDITSEKSNKDDEVMDQQSDEENKITAEQSDEEQNEDTTSDRLNDKENNEASVDQSDEEEDDEEPADLSDGKEQGLEILADQLYIQEQNEEEPVDQSDEEEQDVEVTADQSDEEEQDEEVTADQSDEEEQNVEVTADQSDEEEQDEELTADQSDEEEPNVEETADQSDEEEQDEEVTADQSDEEEQDEELTADQSDEEEPNVEETADQSDEEEQDEEVTADQSDEEEQNVEITADQSDEEEQVEEVTADQSDEEEQNVEETADQSDEEEQNVEVTADQSDEKDSDEEVTADQSDEEEQNEEVTADQSDEEEQNVEVTADQSDEEEQDVEDPADQSDEEQQGDSSAHEPDDETADQTNEMSQENNMSYPEHNGGTTEYQSEHEVSKRTRQTTLEAYLHKIKQDNAEKSRKMVDEIRNSLKVPKRDFNLFKIPQKPVRRIEKVQKPKANKIALSPELIEDMKYKPPKRFKPNNTSWVTKRLYKYLETRLEPKYDFRARIQAEKLVECIYTFTKEVRKHSTTRVEGIAKLKHLMARDDIVKTHHDFYDFVHEFLPREIRMKVVPDILNKIPLPRDGVFTDIIK